MKSAFTSSENVIKLNALKKNSDGFVCGFKAYTALKSHIYKWIQINLLLKRLV